MQIIVTHLTRMSAGKICVAGIDVATGSNIRPVNRHKPLTTDFLARHGGPFDLTRRLDLGPTKPRPDLPHVEDHVFDLAAVRALGRITGSEFWRQLRTRTHASLSDIFGPDFRQLGKERCGVELGGGCVSLGYFSPPAPPVLHINKEGKLRALLRDAQFVTDASVTDLRLCQDDHQTPDPDKVEKLNARLQESAEIILSVGLCRPYAKDWSQKPVSYLQVNNLHLREYPLWRLS